MSRAGRSPLAGLLAVLVLQPCNNDVCPLAFGGHPCNGSTGCEQCLNERGDALAPLYADTEGQQLLADRAAADVAARLGVELEPAASEPVCFDCGTHPAASAVDRCAACEEKAEGRYQRWLDDAAGPDLGRRAIVQDLAATGDLWRAQ